MEVISTNQIVDPNTQQPFTGKSLTFLQNALRKDTAGVIEALVTKITGGYSLTVPYVISGCVLSDSNKDVTNGTLFYGGNFYEVVGVNGTTNVARFILTKTQDVTADPVDFTNGTTKNVHDIYKYVATDVSSGGDFIATDLVYLTAPVTKINNLVTAANQTTSSTSFIDLTTATYTTPNDATTRTYLILAKGQCEFTGSSGDHGAIRIMVDGVQKDECKSGVTPSLGSNEFVGGLFCQTIQTVLPNKVIKVQIQSVNGGSIDFKNNSFIVIEL